MHLSILFLAVLAAGTASADTHVGNDEVQDETVSTESAGSTEGHTGGNAGGGTSTSPPFGIVPSCPEEPDGVNDPRRSKPLCGQPPSPTCNANQDTACTMIAAAPKTFPNCASLIRQNATLIHFGACRDERPEPRPQRIAVGFDVKNFHQCMARVAHAKRLKPALAPWLQADGKPMKTREFCKRLFQAPVTEPQTGGASGDAEDDLEEETAVGE